MNTKEAKEGLIYLYCITDKIPKLKEIENLWVGQSEAQPLPSGLAAHPYFIYHQSLYAIVNKVRESEFDEENLKRNLADIEWIKVKAGIHEKVIEGIMRNAGVIPFKFATIFNTEDNLKTMLGEHLEEFKDILKKLEDKEEWGVKIYCDLEELKEIVIQEDGEISKLDKEINGSTTPIRLTSFAQGCPERSRRTLTIDPEPFGLAQGKLRRRVNSLGPGKAYLLKKKKEELLNIAVNKKLTEYGQVSFDRLKEKSTEARINKLLPKEVTERNDEMILNSAFLINKDKVGDFFNIVEELRTKYADRGLFFDCTGSWPPYNFCK